MPEWSKGVDLRSTTGLCAWVRTPQLTGFRVFERSGLNGSFGNCTRTRRVYSSAVERLTADQQVPGSNPGVPFLQVASVIYLLPGGAGVSEL